MKATYKGSWETVEVTDYERKLGKDYYKVTFPDGTEKWVNTINLIFFAATVLEKLIPVLKNIWKQIKG